MQRSAPIQPKTSETLPKCSRHSNRPAGRRSPRGRNAKIRCSLRQSAVKVGKGGAEKRSCNTTGRRPLGCRPLDIVAPGICSALVGSRPMPLWERRHLPPSNPMEIMRRHRGRTSGRKSDAPVVFVAGHTMRRSRLADTAPCCQRTSTGIDRRLYNADKNLAQIPLLSCQNLSLYIRCLQIM